jgi:hypothetical protein
VSAVLLRFNSREIIDKRGRCTSLSQPTPWSLIASFAERLKDVLVSLLPSK